MRRFLFIIAAVTLSLACTAEERPVLFEQLPAPIKNFVQSNYPDAKVSYSFVDDDIIKPDYSLRLSNGVELTFSNDGALEKIYSREGVPAGVVPVQIRDYVAGYYPDTRIIEYEVGRRDYDIKLSNGLEIKFNRNFRVVEFDD